MSNADLEAVFDIARRVVADMEREVELNVPDRTYISPGLVQRWADKFKALVIPADCPLDCCDATPCPRCVAAGTAICADCGEEAAEVYCCKCLLQLPVPVRDTHPSMPDKVRAGEGDSDQPCPSLACTAGNYRSLELVDGRIRMVCTCGVAGAWAGDDGEANNNWDRLPRSETDGD